jgi:hypothetical protein
MTFSSDQKLNASNQTFGGVPLIFGLGYNFSIGSNWLGYSHSKTHTQ